MIKVAIIGKFGYLGHNLKKYLQKKKNINLKAFSYEEFCNIKNINTFSFIINAAINKKFIENKYNKNLDIDLKISNKIFDTNCKFIFLSTRKIYSNVPNIKEESKLKPQDLYAKNKVISERQCFKVLNKKLIILRIPNIIGGEIKNNRKVRVSFYENYLKIIKKKNKFFYENYYKDFISMEQFCKIMLKILKSNLNGIYNVSLGKKIYIKELLSWLNFANKDKKLFIESAHKLKNENFYLNNKKISKTLNIKIKKIELKKYCIYLSKKIFKNEYHKKIR